MFLNYLTTEISKKTLHRECCIVFVVVVVAAAAVVVVVLLFLVRRHRNQGTTEIHFRLFGPRQPNSGGRNVT
jgi:NADH:ubiquinone oxidoreductase subunit K